MKFRNRIVIAFAILMVVPIGLVFLSMTLLNNYQNRIFVRAYGVESPDFSLLGTNTVELFDAITDEANDYTLSKISTEKESFRDEAYLENLNKELDHWCSFLIVRTSDSFVYIGTTDEWGTKLFNSLPGFGAASGGSLRIYTGSETNCLLNQNDVEFQDGTTASIFVVTHVGTLPQIKTLYTEMGVCIVLIVLFTAIILLLWIYSSMLIPMRKLQLATRQIRDGNLDFELTVQGEDEISQLCMDFEDMRQRLKATSEEKVHFDEEYKELLSNISHDLKTPITAIKGYCEGIMDGVASTPEKLEKYIRTVYNKANDMDRLIDELTFYSKIDTDKIPYNFAPINVAAYFEDCCDELRLDLEGQGIGLSYMNYCDSHIKIIADAEQMKRVVNNIVSNSVKYMDKPHGMIYIRIKDLGDFVQVEIEDNGKGIAAKDLPNIFDRFYRTDKARNSRKGGSGIGLSIVRKIIDEHGGQIWATSREGIGTVMHFALRKYQEVPNE